MADDDGIDIEEHDLLDNPALRQMFPDMTLLKIEIDSFEGLDYTTPPDDDKEEAGPLTTHKLNVEVIGEVKDEGSKHKQLPAEENIEIIEIEEEEGTTSEVQPINTNKIILGSKPNKPFEFEEEIFEEKVKCYDVKVVLDDLKPYLRASERFCMKCLILFPDKLALDSHEKKYHIAEDITLPLEHACDSKIDTKVNNDTVKCSMCNDLFTCRTTLYKHIKQFHNSSSQTEIPNMMSKVKDDMKKKQQENNECFHCKKSFTTQKSLIEHLYSILQAKKNVYECKICSSSFSEIEVLNQHMVSHKPCVVLLNDVAKQVKTPISKRNEPSKTSPSKILKPSELQNEDNLNYEINITEPRNICQNKEGYYRCYICSYYFTNTKPYLKHLATKHNVNSYCNQQEKEQFDSMCKYCSNNYNSLLSYNIHLGTMHKEHVNSSGKQMPKKTEVVDRSKSIPVNPTHIKESNAQSKVVPQLKPLLQSALFKCAKCDIHFLSSKIARNHTEHIEMLINWKCSICQRILKNEDKILHGEQHKYSQEFVVYNLCPNTSTPILFHCLNCKVHFDEDSYFKHHSTCKTETPNSVFCIICDVLIDSSISKMHRSEHVSQNIKSTDYIIVESNILATCNSNPKTGDDSVAVTTKSPSIAKMREKGIFKRKGIENADIPHKKEKSSEDFLNLTYCHTCKCFLTKNSESHVDQPCKKTIKRICTICGLTLTETSFKSHCQLHKSRKNMKLKDFNFFDIHSGKQIFPPVPEYPKCDKCKVHFTSKGAHKCNATEHLTCHLCNITLTEDAFRLHLLFHNYFRTGVQSQLANSSTEKQSVKQSVEMEGIMYRCKNCCICIDSYDKVVEHCQEHYCNEEESTETVKCRICDLIFDKSCIDRHTKLHKSHIKEDWFTILNFDIFYFTSENKIWIEHVFGTIPENQRNEIVNKSIYKCECRIKMDVIQNGNSDYTVYKCDKCRSFIDESGLYKHAENACFKLRKHPCSVCGLPFNSSVSRIQHEKVHEKPNINLKTYRIVTFNKEEDKALNKLLYSRSQYYILYQCRNCSIALDKSQIINHTNCSVRNLKTCSACGLLISNDDFDAHILRHKELPKFIQKNIKILLFGEVAKNSKEKPKEVVSLFPGIVYDYTFYRCSKCQVCLKSEEESHTCSFGSNRLKCSVCKLYFTTNKLKNHIRLHERDPDFLRSNMRILEINLSEAPSKSTNEVFLLPKKTIDDSDDDNINRQSLHYQENQKINKVEIKEEDAKIFKCVCGLHFLDQITVVSHMKKCDVKSRAARQKCTKCGLLFTQNILFNHLILHHGNKLNVYKFHIVDMTSYTIIFRCFKCNLHFEQLNQINDHLLTCVGLTDGKVCIFCNLKFECTSFLAHDCSNVNNVNAGFEVIDLNEPLVLSSAFVGLHHGICKRPEITQREDTEEEISNKDLEQLDATLSKPALISEVKEIPNKDAVPSFSGKSTEIKIVDQESKQSDVVTSSALENSHENAESLCSSQELHIDANVGLVDMDIDETVPDSASEIVLNSSNESNKLSDQTNDVEPVGSSSDAAPMDKMYASEHRKQWHQNQREAGFRPAFSIPCSEFSDRTRGSPRGGRRRGARGSPRGGFRSSCSGYGGGPRGGNNGAPRGGNYGAPRGDNYSAPRGGKYGAPRGGKYGAPRGGKYGSPRGGKYGAPRGGKYGLPRGGPYGVPRAGKYGAPRGKSYGAPCGSNYGAPRGRGANYGAPSGCEATYGALQGRNHGAPFGENYDVCSPHGEPHDDNQGDLYGGNFGFHNPHGEAYGDNQGDPCGGNFDFHAPHDGNYDVNNSHGAPGNDHGFQAQDIMPVGYWPHNLLF